MIQPQGIETVAAIVAITIIKLVAIYAGFKIVWLGHDTLIRGIKGEFEFRSKTENKMGVTLKSASPGLLFVLLGSLIIAGALFVEKPVKEKGGEVKVEPPRTGIQPENIEP